MVDISKNNAGEHAMRTLCFCAQISGRRKQRLWEPSTRIWLVTVILLLGVGCGELDDASPEESGPLTLQGELWQSADDEGLLFTNGTEYFLLKELEACVVDNDSGTYAVDGDTVTLTNRVDGSSETYTFAIVGTRLELASGGSVEAWERNTSSPCTDVELVHRLDETPAACCFDGSAYECGRVVCSDLDSEDLQEMDCFAAPERDAECE